MAQMEIERDSSLEGEEKNAGLANLHEEHTNKQIYIHQGNKYTESWREVSLFTQMI